MNPSATSPVVHTPIDDDGQSHLITVRTPSSHSATPSNASINSTPPTRRYAVQVDPLQDDRATEIKLLSFARPHMRAFHYAWLSFFIAFFGWFSIPPLMPTIKKQLNLTSDQVANANIASVASTIAGRVVIGPLCDRYGPRVIQATLLVLGAVPVACAAFVNDYMGLFIVRFFIGLVGCSFVATTYWTSIVFAKQVVGSANALAAGWGNLGAGVTYLVTPLLFNVMTSCGLGLDDDLGWRVTLCFPAVAMVVIGVLLYLYSDDCPQGNYVHLRRMKNAASGQTDGSADSLTAETVVGMKTALRMAARVPATWILAFQYACSFGVELQVHNVLSLYYYEDFVQDDCNVATDADKCRILTQTTAGLISSLFGLMCIFARAMGGYASDAASRKYHMKGRIVVQFLAFAGQATTLFVYANARTVSTSIPCLILFGIFVQACTGTTFGIVPYVAPRFTGATSGIVGAGGNVGALCWGFVFKGVGDRAQSFQYLSICVAVATLLCAVIHVDGQGGVNWRQDRGAAANGSDHGATQRLVLVDDELK